MTCPRALTITSHHPLRLMQALSDALVLRHARTMTECLDCIEHPDRRCDDHATDLSLIAGYQQDLAEIHDIIAGASGCQHSPHPATT